MTTILVVDDHPTFRSTARALLEAEGFDVVGQSGTADDAGSSARIILISSRDASDFGSLVGESDVCGFVTKNALSGAAIRALLP